MRSGGGWLHQASAHANGRNEDLIRTILLAPELGDRQARDLSALAFGGSAEANREFGEEEYRATVRAVFVG